jgi:Uma2 family endonuclease
MVDTMMVDFPALANKPDDPIRQDRSEPMATTPRSSTRRAIEYPTGDGKPMAETDIHRQIMVDLIEILEDRYANDPNVYVSGDLMYFYEEGNKRKHVAPDVFLVRGVPKRPPRDHYLAWLEGKHPDIVIEVTSKTTRKTDEGKKRELYRDVLRVPEYFQFDPTEDYLKPSMQGHRLVDGQYAPIQPVAGRLPSELLGLHFERDGTSLRLYDPVTGRWLPTRQEDRAEERRRAAEAEAEVARLRREIEEVRRGRSGQD